MSPSETLDTLRRCEIFSGVQARTLDQLCAECIDRRVPGGQYILQEGEPAHSLFTLGRGQAAVLRCWQGKQFVLDHLQAGACFGEVGLLDPSPRMASVLAVEDSETLEIPAGALWQLLHHDASEFALIQLNLARAVSRRFRLVSQRLFDGRMRAAQLHRTQRAANAAAGNLMQPTH